MTSTDKSTEIKKQHWNVEGSKGNDRGIKKSEESVVPFPFLFIGI